MFFKTTIIDKFLHQCSFLYACICSLCGSKTGKTVSFLFMEGGRVQKMCNPDITWKENKPESQAGLFIVLVNTNIKDYISGCTFALMGFQSA